MILFTLPSLSEYKKKFQSLKYNIVPKKIYSITYTKLLVEKLLTEKEYEYHCKTSKFLTKFVSEKLIHVRCHVSCILYQLNQVFWPKSIGSLQKKKGIVKFNLTKNLKVISLKYIQIGICTEMIYFKI